jgi:hypothetical protein
MIDLKGVNKSHLQRQKNIPTQFSSIKIQIHAKRESRFTPYRLVVVKFLVFLTIWNHAEFNHNWD